MERKEGKKQGRNDQAQLEAGMVFKTFSNQHSMGTNQSEWTLASDGQHSCSGDAEASLGKAGTSSPSPRMEPATPVRAVVRSIIGSGSK